MLLTQAFRLTHKAVVSFVGGGGKTTAMLRLADELANQGRHVIVTTTTHLFAAQVQGRSFPVLTFDPARSLDWNELGTHQIVAIVGNPVGDKVSGLPPDLVDELAARPERDVILVEADGARIKPLKAPAEHEPVIPASTSLLVPVVGASVFGKLLDEQYVHRPELVARLAGATIGEQVAPELVARVLAHPQGGLKSKPAGARVHVLVNQVDSERELAPAQELARLLLKQDVIEAVTLGSVMSAASPVRETHRRVAAIVLAAGAGTRMGERVKQLLPWRGKTLIENAIDVAANSKATETIVVLGSRADEIQRVVSNYRVRIVHNPDWAQGHSSSIRVGLNSLSPLVDAAIFINADQPYLTSDIVDALITRYRATDARIIAPLYAGKRGSPVLFQREHFAELESLSGEQGGREVLQKYPVEFVSFDRPQAGTDVDTPEEYAALGN